MGEDLSSIFLRKENYPFEGEEFTQKIAELLLNEQLDAAVLDSLIKSCLSYPCSTFQEEVFCLKNFTTILLFFRKNISEHQKILLSSLRLLLKKIQHEHPLLDLLEELNYELLLCKQKRKIIGLKDHFEAPIVQSEIAAPAALLGTLRKDEELLSIADSIAHKQLQREGNDFFPFLALWSKCEDYSSIDILLSYYFMSFTVGYLLKDQRAFQKSTLFLQKIAQEKKKVTLPVFILLLQKWIKEIEPIGQKEPYYLPEQNSCYDSEDSLFIYKGSNWSSAFTFQGMNTSFAEIKASKIAIPALGPQFFPLNSSYGFGIYHSFPTQFYDEKTKIFKGWTRLCEGMKDKNKCHPSSLWIGLDAQFEDRFLHLSFMGIDESKEVRVAFSFYVKAEECLVEEKVVVKARSLNRFSGLAAKVECISEKERIKIEALEPVTIHIIPLAGAGFFWDADFLIAYEMQPSLKSISLKF